LRKSRRETRDSPGFIRAQTWPQNCQIHINLDHAGFHIKILSKSGRDSTEDRADIHRPLQNSLELGAAGCKIKRQCILEGELLVWNDAMAMIQPFYKIRKHVRRSGRYIGTARDSPADLNEHLMVIFYDILLLDDRFCASETHDKRRYLLARLVRHIPGEAEIGSQSSRPFRRKCQSVSSTGPANSPSLYRDEVRHSVG
jgi:DNA ligase-4